MATWTYDRIGANHSGLCLVCEELTGSRPDQLAETVLYRQRDAETGKSDYRVAHGGCVGIEIKRAISGKLKVIGSPDAEIDLTPATAEQQAQIKALDAELKALAQQKPSTETSIWSAGISPTWKLLTKTQQQATQAIATLQEKVAARRAKIVAAGAAAKSPRELAIEQIRALMAEHKIAPNELLSALGVADRFQLIETA